MVAIVGAVSAVYVGSTGAFFSDTETSTANTFAAGAIDLKVDNDSYYNGVATSTTSWQMTDLTIEKFFNFFDLKPADYGEDTISLHVDTNDAYLCVDVTLTSNDDNGINEPESQVDQTDGPGNGELADAVNFVWWADDGDNVLEAGETVLPGGPLGALAIGATTTVALADSQTNIWTGVGGPAPGNETLYVGKAWCFGDIGVAPLPAGDYPQGPAGDNNNNTVAGEPADGGITCDGAALGNETQTDSLTANISFNAVQARNNGNFLCLPPPPPITRACVENEVYASATHNVDQGARKNGTVVTVDRTNPNYALGAPQSLGTPYDAPVVANSFFSLGFKSTPPGTTATSTPGGSIVLEFPGVIVNGAGADLKLWEVTGGTTYPDELVRVEVSNSLAGPWTQVAAGVTRDAEIDIAPVVSAKYVRITDVSPPAAFETTADGYDLDAVQALNCEIPLVD